MGAQEAFEKVVANRLFFCVCVCVSVCCVIVVVCPYKDSEYTQKIITWSSNHMINQRSTVRIKWRFITQLDRKIY